MRCKACDYALWQISSRLCPECGAPFKPSDYEFTLNSVRFCCPHCEQDYYGTGPSGHLVPRTFACVKCARTIDMDEMVLLPTEGVKESQTEGLRQPWLERGTRRGFFSALFAGIGHALVKPGQLLRATPVESGAWQATLFMLATLGSLCLIYGVFMLVFFAIVLGASSSMGGGPTFGVGLNSIGIGLGVAGFFLVVWLVILTLSVLVAHATLKLTGGTAYGLGRTWQALCYASGANVASAVPCLGAYFGWIWWLVSACIALKEAQKVHGGRATLAVLIVPFGSILLFIGGEIALGYFAARSAPYSAPSARSTASFGNPARIGTLTGAIRGPQHPPRHIAEVLVMNSTAVYDLMDTTDNSGGGFMTRMGTIPVGNSNLASFMTLPPAQQRVESQSAAAALPPSTIAYRVGDTVFTYPGIDPQAIPNGFAAQDLWLVIDWPESLVSSTTRNFHVGLADGRTKTITAGAFDQLFTEQNDLRDDCGLPPLPHPSKISNISPALGDAPPQMDLRKSKKKPGTDTAAPDAPPPPPAP